MHRSSPSGCRWSSRPNPTWDQGPGWSPPTGEPASMARAYLHFRGAMAYSGGNGEINRMVGAGRPPRLLDEVRRVLRVKHYSLRTEHAYVGWIRRFILANGKRHPRDV